MRVLVTGATGVVGKPAVDELIRRGHRVRALSRGADHDARQWAEGVEPFAGSVGDARSVRGAADGCDAVLHIAGIVEEDPPEITFERVNVEGTRTLVAEAERAGARRFVYVSSLGAPQGSSAYHRSKAAAEEVVRASALDWLILRPGNVYGPGDEVISLLLKMVRTLPAVPLVGDGDQAFQPVWAGDVAQALALAVERDEPSRVALDVAGTEVTTTNQVLDLLEQLTDKHPPRVPVPEWVARAGAGVAGSLGLKLPVNADQLTMLTEENVLPPGGTNALVEVFGVSPIPLSQGLGLLVDALPERLPSEGRGDLQRQRYWADIRGSRMSAPELLRLVRDDLASLAPEGLLELGAEPGTQHALGVGTTVTMAIPLRGHIQVRVEETTDEAITLVTLQGHPLSGAIRFMASERDGGVTRFEVRSYTRASGLVDLVGMRTVGEPAQHATWESVVERVVERSGGEAGGGVESETETLGEDDARRVEGWVEELVMRRRRESAN